MARRFPTQADDGDFGFGLNLFGQQLDWPKIHLMHAPPVCGGLLVGHSNHKDFGRFDAHSFDTRNPIPGFRVRLGTFFTALAVMAMAGIVFFLFVIEPRRKIYD
jgi:hypothetical protein